MSLSLKATNDGSFTLFNDELNETYHSIHGARQEGEHVFIEYGLDKMEDLAKVNILEIGLGTGLNALLTFQNRKDTQITYYGLEPFPISFDLLSSIIEKNAKDDEEKRLWVDFMTTDTPSESSQGFNFYKIIQNIQNFEAPCKFDLVYFDAFAPNKQPEMWNVAVFERIYTMCASDARLVTYCAQGQFKRNLKSAGFTVYTAPGPPGKREMTVGIREN